MCRSMLSRIICSLFSQTFTSELPEERLIIRNVGDNSVVIKSYIHSTSLFTSNTTTTLGFQIFHHLSRIIIYDIYMLIVSFNRSSSQIRKVNMEETL